MADNDHGFEPTDDVLFRFERRIARRADELSRQHGFDRWNALDHWRTAEREIMTETVSADRVDWNGFLPRHP